MRRFLSLLLIGAILLCALASCKEDPTPPAASQEPSEQGGGAIALYNDQGVQCQLVYPNDAGETVMHAVERMQANFKELTGAELPAYAEASAPVGTAATIYFGNTWAAWDQGIPSDTGYYNYTVSIRNGNLYAYAMYEALLTELVIKLDLQFSKRFANGSLELEEGFSIFGTAAAYRLLSNVPYFDNADYHSTHDCDNGYEMVLIRNATAESFASYCQKLTAKGYTLAAENDMNGNLARTYFNADGVMLHTYLTPHSGEVRVIVANNPDYNSNPSDTNEKFQSFLRPLSADGGMGYLIRLGDGSFLVIDGGYDSDNCANEIYNLLNKLGGIGVVICNSAFLGNIASESKDVFDTLGTKFFKLVAYCFLGGRNTGQMGKGGYAIGSFNILCDRNGVLACTASCTIGNTHIIGVKAGNV